MPIYLGIIRAGTHESYHYIMVCTTVMIIFLSWVHATV